MQGVLVFASAAARDAAITSPQEGQCCYLKDTDAVLTYSGAAWVGFDDSNAIQNSIVDAKGDLVAASGADTPARLAVGANNTVLTADSSQATGLKWATPASGGKVLQVVNASFSTQTTNATTTFADTGLTATITPTLNTSKILVFVHQIGSGKTDGNINSSCTFRLVRGATTLVNDFGGGHGFTNSLVYSFNGTGVTYLDSPATTSATTYKTTFANAVTANFATVQNSNGTSTITLMEIGA
jgi:hypothetical protein